jgi:predicted aminopeptidase
MKRVNAYRDALQNLYARASPWAEEKRQLREAFERDYVELRDRHWGGDRRWDTWVAGLNNAALALLGGYHDGVPAFERLFKAVDGDWPRFHQAVEVLARRPTSERQAWLQGHPLPAGVLDGP